MFEIDILDDAAKFLEELEPKMRAKAYRTIELLKIFGIALRMPHTKKIEGEDNLYELRIQHANNIIRLFYFHYQGKTYIITSGYVKKDTKLDKRELERAIKLRVEFLKGD